MTGIGRRLALRVVLAEIAVFAAVAAAAAFLPARIHLALEKSELAAARPDLGAEGIERLAREKGWALARVPLMDDSDALNEGLRFALSREGMALRRFWVTDGTLAEIRSGKIVQKIWNQGSMRMSFLVRMYSSGGDLVAVGTAIPHADGTSRIVAGILVLALVPALALLVAVTVGFSAAATAPLGALAGQAEAIARGDYSPNEISGPLEFARLAASMDWLAGRVAEGRERAERKNAELGLALAALGHEMRTPLATLRALAAATEEGFAPPDAGTEIAALVARMETVSERLLQVARAESMAVRPSPFDLRDALSAAYARLPAADRKRVILGCEGGSLVMGDRELLETAIDNFLSNAIEHGDGGSVIARISERDSLVSLSVQNGAPGFPDDPEPLWHPFESARKGSHGAGLHVCRVILERHGARFGARKTSSGAEFHFSLPLAAELPG